MTDFKTWAQIRDKVKDDMDLNGEVFVDNAELLNIGNNAIDEAEAEIHRLYEDYFLKSATISLVASTKDYSLPSDIYANKIRYIYYKKNQTDFYKLRKLTLKEIPLIDDTDTNRDFEYLIINDSASAGTVLRFFPTPSASETDVVNVFYLRNANRITTDSDVVDIPEFHSFIEAYIKFKVAEKEVNPLLQSFAVQLEQQRELMKTTLSQMIPDEDQKLPMDLSFYADFDDIDKGFY